MPLTNEGKNTILASLLQNITIRAEALLERFEQAQTVPDEWARGDCLDFQRVDGKSIEDVCDDLQSWVAAVRSVLPPPEAPIHAATNS